MRSEGPDLANRIAWSYLACLLAGVIAGLFALIGAQIARPLACPAVESAGDLALDCGLLWGAGLALLGFAAALGPVLRLLKVQGWVLSTLATVGVVTGLLGLFQFAGQWWWWLVLLFSPALAALLSASFSTQARFRWAQRAVVGGLFGSGIVSMAVWLFTG
ncbi:MAG: hypothetical protein WBH64_03180 [Propionicimonas sp.]